MRATCTLRTAQSYISMQSWGWRTVDTWLPEVSLCRLNSLQETLGQKKWHRQQSYSRLYSSFWLELSFWSKERWRPRENWHDILHIPARHQQLVWRHFLVQAHKQQGCLQQRLQRSLQRRRLGPGLGTLLHHRTNCNGTRNFLRHTDDIVYNNSRWCTCIWQHNVKRGGYKHKHYESILLRASIHVWPKTKLSSAFVGRATMGTRTTNFRGTFRHCWLVIQ